MAVEAREGVSAPGRAVWSVFMQTEVLALRAMNDDRLGPRGKAVSFDSIALKQTRYDW